MEQTWGSFADGAESYMRVADVLFGRINAAFFRVRGAAIVRVQGATRLYRRHRAARGCKGPIVLRYRFSY